MGLPVTTARRRARAGRCSIEDSWLSSTRVASRARIRLASPTVAVCSCMTSGRRSTQAATPIGTQTYPPVDSTTSGLVRSTMPKACSTPSGIRNASATFLASSRGLGERRSLPVVIALNGMCSWRQILASRPLATPTHRNCAWTPVSANRARSSRIVVSAG